MNNFTFQFKHFAPILLFALLSVAVAIGVSAFAVPAPTPARTIESVMAHHMQALNDADLEEVARDYTASSILITKDTGAIRGKENIKQFFELLLTAYFPGGQFTATTLITEGDVAYLEWTCESSQFIATGVDTFVIHGNRILAQTGKLISYSVK
jgi:hypothetical protein